MAIEIVEFFDRLPSGWKTKSFSQKFALKCPAEMLLYGGSVGSLKSETLIVDSLKYYQRPKYRGIIFRKTFPELEFLVDRTRDLYAGTGGRYYEGDHMWRWPWGAVIEFRHMDTPKDVYKQQGKEFQYVGFDESTHHPEFVVRYLLNSRMRSVDEIPLRMRLATNPGNIGSGWHKQIFHGPKCIHCVEKEIAAKREKGIECEWPAKTRHSFELYKDAVWPSDGVPIQHSTCFIPGKLTDHTLFGEGGGQYLKKLKGLPLKLQEALLAGCWEAFEGQYFDCWDSTLHTVALDQIGHKEWWPYWVGIDYGFRHACVAYLCTKNPYTGQVYVIDEYISHRRKGVDVGNDLNKIWGSRYHIKGWFLSPDSFKHDGQSDFSIAEQISQATGLLLDPAYNERISGAMLLYTMLQDKQLYVADSCALLTMAIPTRVHDEKRHEDVSKVDTEDEDDAYDAARYALASFINPNERTVEDKLMEKIKNEFSQDNTIRALQIAKFMAEQNKSRAPQFYR
jgi:hypothetical protein